MSFEAKKCDHQVVFYEKLHPQHWHLALTTTEFLVAPNLRQTLSSVTRDETEKAKSFVKEIPIITIDGNNTAPLLYSRPLPSQRFAGNTRHRRLKRAVRYIHYNTENTHKYSGGRHTYTEKKKKITEANKPTDFMLDAFIMKFNDAPWPEVKKRKMNVGASIPQSDIDEGRGGHHTARFEGGEDFLDQDYLVNQNLTNINLYEANQTDDYHVYVSRIFRDVFPKVEHH
jgi:hypothetical protein